MVRYLKAAIFGGSTLGVALGAASVDGSIEWGYGSGEFWIDWLKVAMLLIIGGIAVRILKRLDGSTPAELARKVDLAVDEGVKANANYLRMAREVEGYKGTIELLRGEVRALSAKMDGLTRIACDDCPVIREDPDKGLGFRVVRPRGKG